MTVAAFKQQFNETFGSKLNVYQGGRLADDAATLSSLGLKADGEFECRSNLTVGSFIERMMSEYGLKVKVYTCDEWVAVLDGLTLESSGKVKKNAVKADMESVIAHQKEEGVSSESDSITLEPISEDLKKRAIFTLLATVAGEDGRVDNVELCISAAAIIGLGIKKEHQIFIKDASEIKKIVHSFSNKEKDLVSAVLCWLAGGKSRQKERELYERLCDSLGLPLFEEKDEKCNSVIRELLGTNQQACPSTNTRNQKNDRRSSDKKTVQKRQQAKADVKKPHVNTTTEVEPEELNTISRYNKSTLLILCCLFGVMGIHRFYTHNTSRGILMLLTAGLFGVLVFVDIVQILSGQYKDGFGKTVSIW